MATTIRQLRRYVQKIAKKAGLDPDETKLAADCIVGICRSGSCKVSDIVRALNHREPFREETREFYKGLAVKSSGIDELPEAWLELIAEPANKMPFIAVDPSDIIKPYGKDFENIGIVRDASDREKRKGPGFPTIQIEATNHAHQNLPLWQETFSTQQPDYRGWYDFIARAMVKVLSRIGVNAIWLFDRGFDAEDFYTILSGLDITWVVRQLQTRNVIFGNDQTMLMSDLAEMLNKPHQTEVPYIDKESHEVKTCPVRFGYAPVRLPGQSGRYWMIVITGLRSDDMVLLTNHEIKSHKQAKQIILAYFRRWAVEEGIRCWKQKTGVEDFRVRNWYSIRRITFLSMLAYGIQALWLVTRPKQAASLIAKVKVFIETVVFLHYRMWDGVRIALRNGG